MGYSSKSPYLKYTVINITRNVRPKKKTTNDVSNLETWIRDVFLFVILPYITMYDSIKGMYSFFKRTTIVIQ